MPNEKCYMRRDCNAHPKRFFLFFASALFFADLSPPNESVNASKKAALLMTAAAEIGNSTKWPARLALAPQHAITNAFEIAIHAV